MSQSGRMKVPSTVQARRMATISECAVGSLRDVTSFQPSEMMVPLRTITAPNGPPLFARIFSSDRALHECLFGHDQTLIIIIRILEQPLNSLSADLYELLSKVFAVQQPKECFWQAFDPVRDRCIHRSDNFGGIARECAYLPSRSQ